MRVVMGSVFLAICFALSVSFAEAQSMSDSILSQKLKSVEVEGDSLHRVLSEIAIKFNIPIGFDSIQTQQKRCDLKNEISLKYDEITVKELITTIIGSTSNCDWEVSDETINVFPKNGKSGLLGVKVRTIEIKKGMSNQGIKEQIIDLPEVKLFLKNNDLSLTTLFTSLSQGKARTDDFSLNDNDVSIQYVLNKIAKNSKSKYWNLSNWGGNKKTIFLNF